MRTAKQYLYGTTFCFDSREQTDAITDAMKAYASEALKVQRELYKHQARLFLSQHHATSTTPESDQLIPFRILDLPEIELP